MRSLNYTLSLLILITARSATAQVQLQSDVHYGSDPQQLLDVCLPAASTGVSLAAVVLIHGGGWASGRKEDFGNVCRYYATNGVVAATINYHNADGSENGKWPAQLTDVQTAIQWLRANAARYRINPKRICVQGDSAGAHLAMVAATDQNHPAAAVTCAIDDFGPIDFTVPAPFQNVLARFFPDSTDAERKQLSKEVSPLYAVSSQTPPTFIANGFEDKLVPISQSIALAIALNHAQVHEVFVGYDGGHEWVGMSRSAKTLVQQMELDFIREAPPR